MLGGQLVQAIFEFVMLDREAVKLLVGLQQLRSWRSMRFCALHGSDLLSVIAAERNITPLPFQDQSIGLSQVLAPEHQRVLDRLE